MRAFYRNTVLPVRPIGGGRHVGFIVNRPTTVSMQYQPDRTDKDKAGQVSEPVFLGGPLRPEAVFALVHSTKVPPGHTLAQAKDVYLLLDAKSVSDAVRRHDDSVRLYAGLVAWQPGELEQEMQRGYWFAMAEDAGIVFSKDTEGLGAELASRLLAMTS